MVTAAGCNHGERDVAGVRVHQVEQPGQHIVGVVYYVGVSCRRRLLLVIPFPGEGLHGFAGMHKIEVHAYHKCPTASAEQQGAIQQEVVDEQESRKRHK